MRRCLDVIFVTVLFTIGILVRTVNYENRVVFTLEQGITLDTTYDYLNGKFSLLGLPNVQRFTSNGHRIFSGPLYNYFLMPFMKLMGTDPIRMTYIATTINSITALLMFLLIKLISNKNIAIIATIFFLFSQTMIDQSLTLWILNPLPMLGLLGMYLLIKYESNYPLWTVFLLGIIGGTLTSLEYMTIFTVLMILFYLIFRTKSVSSILIFGVGFFLPLTPTVLFDVRHDYYHLKTLWQYTLDTLNNPGQSSLRFYHFYHFIPALMYLYAIATDWIITRSKYVGGTIIIIYVLANIYITFSKYPLVTVPNLLNIADKIDQQAKPGFNVVYMPESEYRGYALRYILRVIYRNPPLPFDAYPSATELYVLKTPERSLSTDVPWEISIFEPKNSVDIFETDDKKLRLVKMTK